MKINVTQQFLNYEGKPVRIKDEEGERDFTLRDLIFQALNSRTDEQPTAERSAKSYAITVKVYADKEVNFTANEISFIQERAGKTLTELAYGRLCDMLEPKQTTEQAA